MLESYGLRPLYLADFSLGMTLAGALDGRFMLVVVGIRYLGTVVDIKPLINGRLKHSHHKNVLSRIPNNKAEKSPKARERNTYEKGQRIE